MKLENLRKLLGPLVPEQLRAALHSAGATVRTQNPFENLVVPGNDAPLDAEFIKQWVVPFYMQRLSDLDATGYAGFVAAARRIRPNIVAQLLGDFDWRTRITGAYFAAINDY